MKFFIVRKHLRLYTQSGSGKKEWEKNEIYTYKDLEDVENTGIGATIEEVAQRLDKAGWILIIGDNMHEVIKSVLLRK